VAAHYRRSGASYRADLLTVAIPATRTLAATLPAGPGAGAWRRIGATLREFHDAGVRHADLNAHNVLLDDGGGVHLVDFDRGALVAPGAWREHNLARLQRSLVKLGALGASPSDAPAWRALRAGYDAPRSAPRR
jgi:3-deoxy-D-manno-octulosonic acid kinase